MKFFLRLITAALACAPLVPTPARAATPPRPNIVLMMADDQGWGEVGYHGHPHVKTPVLDSMAAGTLRLDRFYAASPLGSPTRAALFWRRGPNRVVRQGDYKLWQKGSDTLLFNLRLDPHEDRNLAATEPERVATLRALLNTWNAQLMAPKWAPPPSDNTPVVPPGTRRTP
jgi:arylsulfatase A-like enzyme